MRVVNLLSGPLEHVRERPGWNSRAARVGDALGGARIGGTVYELPDGERSFPYHFHHGVEEWLVVIDGAPTVRTPEGERRLAPGDTVCFPAGAAGAHELRGPGRVLVVSANRVPSISVYPETGKLGTRPDDEADRLNFRRADAVDYWDGEE
ncbi:MAG: cupin domain-containing protein [Gaiellaceae bacterium]